MINGAPRFVLGCARFVLGIDASAEMVRLAGSFRSLRAAWSALNLSGRILAGIGRILSSFLLAAAVAGPGITAIGGIGGIGGAEAAEATVTFTDRANAATLAVASGTTVPFLQPIG